MNQVILEGNLGTEVELRHTGAGTPVANFRMATNEPDGKGGLRAEWHRVTVWGKYAQTVTDNLEKGQKVMVRGSLRTRVFDDQQGVKHRDTHVVVAPGGVTFGPKAKAQQSEPTEEVVA